MMTDGVIHFPTIRNRKLADKLKGTIKQAQADSKKLTRMANICAVHGEVKAPLRLRGEGEVYCAQCLADFMDANKIGRTTKQEVPV